MPNKTFFNLDEKKREKIQRALVAEFTQVPLEDCSIKNIVNDAEIPRGSFYQYFEDKEDALKYLITMTHKDGEQEIHNFLQEDTIDVYDFILSICRRESDSIASSHASLRVQLLGQIGKSHRAVQIFNEVISHTAVNNSRFRKYWKNAGLENLPEKSEKAVLELLISTLRETILNILQGNISGEAGLESLKFKLTIIKAGLEQELQKRK